MTRRGWLGLFLLWAACPGSKVERDAGIVAAGPKQLTEVEPNDRPEQAMVISEPAVVTASLGADPSKPDEDWYLLAPPAPRTVDLTVSGIPGADVMLEIYDTDRNRLVAVNSEGEGKPERLPNLGVKGKLLVRVTSAKRGAGGAYALTALFSEPAAGFETEPNDRAADANSLPLGQSISGFIGHSADEDWYRYELIPSDGAPGAPPRAEDGGGTGPTGGLPPGPTGGPRSATAGAPGSATAGGPGSAAAGAPGPGGGPAPASSGGPVTGPASGATSIAPGGPAPNADAGVTQPAPEPRIALRIELTAVEGVRFDLQVL